MPINNDLSADLAPDTMSDLVSDSAPDQAQRFGKTRQARAQAVAEDYVELIAELLAETGEARNVDMARRLGVSHATVIKTIGRLKRETLVRSEPYRGVFLTEAGERLARIVRNRHRVVVEILLALGVAHEDAEADAEGIEHYVSPNTLAAFSRFLEKRAGSMPDARSSETPVQDAERSSHITRS
jgi:DtxR family manganese transport transcriptional regulator